MYVFLGVCFVVGVARKNRKNPKSLLAVQDFLVKKKISRDEENPRYRTFPCLGKFCTFFSLKKKHTFQLQVLDKSTKTKTKFD